MQNESSNLTTGNEAALPMLEHFKSIYYWVNAKPDSQIKILEGRKLVDINAIYAINASIIEKLRTHSLNGSITTIDIIFEKSQIKSFSNFSQFEQENWGMINETIRHITISWDMSVKLPMYELPQRHLLKVKIGDALPPKDVFQLLFTSDNESELVESRAEGVVKIDFINQVLATELLERVQNWHNGLPAVNSSKTIKFLKDKHSGVLTTLSKYLPVALIVIFAFCLPIIQRFGYFNVLNIDTVVYLLCTMFVVYNINDYIIRIALRYISKKIDLFKDFKPFNISNGDMLYQAKVEEDNRGILKQLRRTVIIMFLSLPAAIIIKLITNYLGL